MVYVEVVGKFVHLIGGDSNLKCKAGNISTIISEIGQNHPEFFKKVYSEGFVDNINIFHTKRSKTERDLYLKFIFSKSNEYYIGENDDLCIIPPIEFNDEYYRADAKGYLLNYMEWNERLAAFMAAEDGVELGEEHWRVLKFLRDYFREHKKAPILKILTKEMKKKFGKEKGNTKYLYELYPAGPAKQACRYAGLPKPTG